MQVALVHDYLKEFGGAERVLKALSEIWPKAPIYTAFCQKNSTAGKAFAGKKVIESKFAPLIKYRNLHSPLRFLTPRVWKSFNLSEFDLVISSASWYITRGFKVGKETKVVCYCHTPPRYLYGYPTSIEWKKYWPVRLYGQLIGHFLRQFDYKTAQGVDWFIANSKNVARRIEKFYRRGSTIIYPPVEVEKIIKATQELEPEDYYLSVSRVVGAKGIELAVQAAHQAGVKLKIVGEPAGLRWFGKSLDSLKGDGVEFLGRVSDSDLYKLYGQCRAVLALAEDEDFGITPVEAMAAGRPVIVYRGGGYLESVVEGKTGKFFDSRNPEDLAKLLKKFDDSNHRNFQAHVCRGQAKKFSKKRFKKEVKTFIKESLR